MASPTVAAMFVMALTTLARGRIFSSLPRVMAAIREITIFPSVRLAMLESRGLASAAFTVMMTISARATADRLSEVTSSFFGRGLSTVAGFRLVMIARETLPDLVTALATASPIFPPPSTAIINALPPHGAAFSAFRGGTGNCLDEG